MKISATELNQRAYKAEDLRAQEKRNEDYRKLVEKRRLDRIVEERIARNRRLGLDKGYNIDVEC
jgi:asparagine synthetase B (glutamine-hydrolysing)